MAEHKINVFLRMRPTKKGQVQHELVDDGAGVVFDVPKENLSTEVINNSKERHEFRFAQVFERDARQEDIFKAVALPTILSALDGFNGTIFAYGQTGSGKTFTITGGPERYEDRGIIPRTLSHLFSEFRRRSDYSYQMHVSYLEIYNESGYDLLDPSLEDNAKALEDLPRVSLQEDEDGNIHLRNLSAHQASSEEEALNFLFLGDTNRTTSETPMNLASSRSHCIFTVFLTATKHGSDVIRKSKIHLVDLAGSERVYKTGNAGTLLRESKFINASLHFLEMVIVALQERSTGKKRSHIPYRNSMMTSVLRDSLGGNCKTSMIATMNPDRAHTDESLSTCRFAQRVACVSNAVKVNEEVDPQMVIRRLKKEVADLREELALARGGDADNDQDMSEETENHLRAMVHEYLADTNSESELNVGPHMHKIRICFRVLKQMYCEGGGGKGGGGRGSEEQEEQIRKLTHQVKQRDNEIVILVNMINEAKKSGAALSGVNMGGAGAGNEGRSVSAGPGSLVGGGLGGNGGKGGGAGAGGTVAPLVDPEILKDRAKAFEVFRETYHKNEAIESNKAALKGKYDEAKSVGEAVNKARSKISDIKAKIEQLRVERAMRGEGGEEAEADPEEEALKAQIDGNKTEYKDKFNRLRQLKAEIEHIQGIMEKQRTGLQKDFENWYNLMVRQHKSALKEAAGAGGGGWGADAGGAKSPLKGAVSGAGHGSGGGAGRGELGEGQISTGNKEADADIAAFYKARQQLMEKNASK